MALDASIFNALGRGVKSVQDYDNEAMQAQSNALGIQNQRMNLVGAQQKQQEYTRSLAEQERVRNALQMLPPGATPEQRIGAYRGSGTMFGYSQADTLEKALVEQRKGNAAAGKDEAQTAAEKFKLRIGHSEQAIKDIAALQSPQDALAGIDRHLASGDIDEAKADMLRRSVPQDPGQFPQWQVGMLRQIMSAADQIKTQAEAEKQAEQVRQFGVTSGMTDRHQRATEGLTARGQNLTDERARDFNATKVEENKIKRGEAEQTKELTKSSQLASFDTMLGTLDRLSKHPGLPGSVGLRGALPTMPGSEAANFQAELNTFQSQAFLPMVAQLKGMGALSDAEGKKLTAAVGALDPKMGEKAFRDSVGRITAEMKSAQQRVAGTTNAKPAKTVVRTGKDASGKKVVQYSDGSIEHAD